MSIPDSDRRPVAQAAMIWFRRLHLYLGLLLFPWAILYGVTAFLFNHPTAFNHQPIVVFGPDAIRETALQSLESPASIAQEFIAILNERQKPVIPYELAGEARFNREYAFATVKAYDQTIGLLVDAKTGHGQIRSQLTSEKKPQEKPPFVAGRVEPAVRRQAGEIVSPKPDPVDMIRIKNPLHERFKAAIPTLLEKYRFPNGEITITSVPDVVVPVRADGRVWQASFNPMTGSVSGRADNVNSENELGWRRFLLRLHTAHGYPSETNSRWWWAVIVDVMAFVLCFWGLSGLTMWWRLKPQRRIGFVLLALSAVIATALGFSMHSTMTGP